MAIKALTRPDKDVDGITVLPSAYLCCKLEIKGIGRIPVAGIATVVNPVNHQPLSVVEDSATHGYIDNVPFRSRHPEESNTVATDLACMCELLGEEEVQEARKRWAVSWTGPTRRR